MISARPKPLWGAGGEPSGAMSPPRTNSTGSVVGRPSRSRIMPSGTGRLRCAASRTLNPALVVVATSSTTGG
jgi:hypothetical protein